MSYYKIKTISFSQKENKVFVTAADSSLRPLQYIRSEYAAATVNFREKVESLWVNVMEGNFQLISSCRWCKSVNEAFAKKRTISNGMDVLLDNKDQSAVILPEDSGFDWPEVAYADLDSLPEVLKKYPDLIPLCVIEAEYQSAERAVADGYQKVYDGIYAIKTTKGVSYAKIIGY